MKNAVSLFLLLVALPVACSKEAGVESVAHTGEGEAAVCAAQGGDLRRVCMAQGHQCVKPFPDAGKVCSDSAECAGECLIDLATYCNESGECADPKVPNPGDAVTGVCQRNDDPCGSFVIVREGRAQPIIHRD